MTAIKQKIDKLNILLGQEEDELSYHEKRIGMRCTLCRNRIKSVEQLIKRLKQINEN